MTQKTLPAETYDAMHLAVQHLAPKVEAGESLAVVVLEDTHVLLGPDYWASPDDVMKFELGAAAQALELGTRWGAFAANVVDAIPSSTIGMFIRPPTTGVVQPDEREVLHVLTFDVEAGLEGGGYDVTRIPFTRDGATATFARAQSYTGEMTIGPETPGFHFLQALLDGTP